MTYKQWCREWLSNYVYPSLKIRTSVRYENIIKYQILPWLGENELENISPLLIQRFVTNLSKNGNVKTGQGLSASTVNSTISVLKNSLKTAFEIGVLSEDVASKIKRPKREEKRVECFSVSEQKLLQERAINGKRKFIGVIVCLYCGLRLGEVLALKWADVDLSGAQMTISKTCFDKFVDGKNERFEYSAKTYSSNRIIPIPAFLRSLLKNYKKTAQSEYVVEDKGKMVGVRSYQRSFELLQRKCNIPRKNFHALRHTFATRAIELGMDVKTLSEILGHKNSVITLNRYVHSLNSHKRAMMNKLGKVFDVGV